jgi:hypothetical protein
VRTARLLGSFLWYRPGLCQCQVSDRLPLQAYKSPSFLRPKPGLLPAKAVLLPSQAGSTTAYRLRWCGATSAPKASQLRGLSGPLLILHKRGSGPLPQDTAMKKLRIVRFRFGTS